MDYKINVRNHWWFDAGIAGLYFIGDRIKNNENYKDIKLYFDEDSLIIKGEEERSIRAFLEQCYKELASLYWNVSTKSQKEKMEWVVYDKEREEFFLAPRRNPTPVVQKFTGARSWKAESLEYKKLDEALRTKTDEFLNETCKSLWGNKQKLLFSLPESQPRIKILPKENKKRQSTCSICGKFTSNLSGISQPSFLLFASQSATRSFHSQGRKVAKLCWECELLSKFTMDTINYKQDGSTISLLLLNSPNLQHNINNQRKIGSCSALRGIDEDYFYKNIGFDPDGLIGRARMPYELLWSYFADTYAVLKGNSRDETQQGDFFAQFLSEVISAPVEIVVIILEGKGQTFITKELIFYNDVSYVYRLIDHLSDNSIDIKKMYNSLYETDSKGKTKPTRNNIFKKLLNKHCIIKDIEALAMRKVFDNEYINVSNMLKFLTEYYLIIKEDVMNREEIEVAVDLGKRIVRQPYIASGNDKEILKKIKGDLYALRKTRTVTDFITQLNTLQFRYGLSVSKSILEGILNNVPFEDFKGYCIMGALNNFNYYNSQQSKKGDKKDD